MKSDFGKFIRDARRNAGLTQKDIADAFGWTSCQFQSNLERSLAILPLKNAKKFCKLTGIDKEELASMYVKHYKVEIKKALNL